MVNAVQEVQRLGQSIWYDNIRRGLIKSGELGSLIELGVTGVTSNPTIFEKAIAGSTDYDQALLELTKGDTSTTRIFLSASECISSELKDFRAMCFIETSNHRGAEANAFHNALHHTLNFDPITMGESLFRQDKGAADQVLKQVLGTKGHSDADEAKPSKHWANLDAPNTEHRSCTDEQEAAPHSFDKPFHHYRAEDLL